MACSQGNLRLARYLVGCGANAEHEVCNVCDVNSNDVVRYTAAKIARQHDHHVCADYMDRVNATDAFLDRVLSWRTDGGELVKQPRSLQPFGGAGFARGAGGGWLTDVRRSAWQHFHQKTRHHKGVDSNRLSHSNPDFWEELSTDERKACAVLGWTTADMLDDRRDAPRVARPFQGAEGRGLGDGLQPGDMVQR